MSTRDEIFGLNTVPIVVPSGATNALLVVGVEGQAATLLKYASGGSISIIGITPMGATYTGAQLVSAGNSGGYLLGTSEVVSIDGSARYYLMATGSTCTVNRMFGLTSGF